MEAKNPMYRLALISGLCLMVVIVIYLFSLAEDINPQFSPKSIARIMSFSEASMAKEVLTADEAQNFPGSLVFSVVWPEDNKAATLIPDLRTLSQDRDTVWDLMNHCNLTLLNVDGSVYGLMPKHMRGDNLNLEGALKQGGLKVASRGEIIMVSLDKFGQEPLSCSLLKRVDSEIDNSPCTLSILNCFPGDDHVYRYTIRGDVHYLDAHDQKLIQSFCHYPQGSDGKNSRSHDGMYVVRIPNIMSEEIIGMYGGAAVATFKGQEYFLGLNAMTIMLAAIDGDKTSYITLIAIDPVLKSDFKFPAP